MNGRKWYGEYIMLVSWDEDEQCNAETRSFDLVSG